MFFSCFYYLVSFVFSEFCNTCKKNNASLGICPECWKEVDFISKNCQKCGCLVAYDVELCESCNIQKYTKSLANQNTTNHMAATDQCYINQSTIEYSPINQNISHNSAYNLSHDQVNRNFSIFMYSGLGKKLMLQFKNGNYWNILPFFFSILSKNYLLNLMPQNVMNQIDFIIPVPLHKIRLLQRGYNQSHIIAKILSKSLNKRCVRLLKRTKKTIPQEKMTLAERRKNVANAFDISTVFKIRKILVSKISFLFSLLSTTRNLKNMKQNLLQNWPNAVKVNILQLNILKYIQKNRSLKISIENNTLDSKLLNERKEAEEYKKNIIRGTVGGTIRGKNILIVDDVFTTGSTLNECARTCKLHGANQIYTFTIANTYTSQRVINMLYKNLEKDNDEYD